MSGRARRDPASVLVTPTEDAGVKPLTHEPPRPMPRNVLLNPIKLPPMRRIQGEVNTDESE